VRGRGERQAREREGGKRDAKERQERGARGKRGKVPATARIMRERESVIEGERERERERAGKRQTVRIREETSDLKKKNGACVRERERERYFLKTRERKKFARYLVRCLVAVDCNTLQHTATRCNYTILGQIIGGR